MINPCIILLCVLLLLRKNEEECLHNLLDHCLCSKAQTQMHRHIDSHAHTFTFLILLIKALNTINTIFQEFLWNVQQEWRMRLVTFLVVSSWTSACNMQNVHTTTCTCTESTVWQYLLICISTLAIIQMESLYLQNSFVFAAILFQLGSACLVKMTHLLA